ncbi:MAG TPA: DNA polymerase/3'-5' exonuclease PolX, partial [Saprospiraceae bacterium]|nr:DNA polymerase/3'-5' exonuclease PolX [Saprospiraceae bacterium]
QEDIRQKLEYYQRSLGHYRYANLEAEAKSLLAALQSALPEGNIALAGDVARYCNTLETIDFVAIHHSDWPSVLQQAGLSADAPDASPIIARTASGVPLRIFLCNPEEFGSKQFRYTAGQAFMEAFVAAFPGVDFRRLPTEKAVFQKVGLPFIAPELRDWPAAIELAQKNALPELLSEKDIRGVIHAHSTYSDGLHSLSDMAEYARTQGYEYLGITDHSKSAFYAQGLEPERVLMQWREVDALNAAYAATGHKFRIFKGIESDILNDGSLDYDAELLAGFDFIIASVHSNLRMDEAKATRRLLTAIENPHTSILGHPTGRLLLSRAGYPIDHRLLIDACAANGVAIELNANPYRLDLDWTWIPYAMEKGVLIAVNPDAHSREGIHDIHFGVCSARKGGLTAAACLNVLDAEEFGAWAGRKG